MPRQTIHRRVDRLKSRNRTMPTKKHAPRVTVSHVGWVVGNELTPSPRNLLHAPRHAQLGEGLGQRLFAVLVRFVGLGSLTGRFAKLLLRFVFVELVFRNRPAGEHRDDIVVDLDKAAVDIVDVGLVAELDPHFAVTEPADHRSVARGDADFAVVERQRHEVGLRLEGRLLGRNDDERDLGHAGLVFLGLGFHLLGLFLGLFDDSNVHERLLRQVIPFTVTEFLEAADRVFERRDFARLAGEDLGHQKRLRQESLDTAGAMDDQLVVFAQFVDAEDRDDVLQVACSAEESSAGRWRAIIVVTLADVLRIKNPAGRANGIDRGDKYPFPKSIAQQRKSNASR